MANSQFYQFLFSKNAAMSYLQGSVVIGATGAVGTTTGSGIDSVVRLSAGKYQINLDENYYRLLNANVNFRAPVSGADVAAASLSAGTVYQITAVGNTNWQTAGLDSSKTAAVGMAFKATAASTGTGTAKVLGVSGISNVELIGDNNLTVIDPVNPYIIIQCLAATDASTTTLIATDPAEGSVMLFDLMLRNSSVKGKGE